MKINKIIRFIPAIVWMLIIFYFSSRSTVGIGTNQTDRFLILKSFHLIEYAVLAILFSIAIYNNKLVIFVAYLYAISDELHQHFIPGRTGLFRDTLIDLVGILIGIFIFNKIKHLKILKNKSLTALNKTVLMYICYILKYVFMKKIFLSFAIIIAVSSFSFLLTKAYFTDKKTSSGNKFTVGTLNLEVGDSQNKQIEPFVISDLGSSEIKGQKIWKLKNVGSLPGQLIINFDNVVNNENGCNTPEGEVDQTCNSPGPNEGELGNVVSANFYINNVSKVSVPLNQNGSQSLNNYWNNELNTIVLEPNQEFELKMEWFESGTYGNEIQSDSLAFDLNFNLQQIIK